MTKDRQAAAVVAEAAESFEVVGGRLESGLVLLCDHACNAIPPEYGTLGLPPAELERHIAYDIGIAGVSRHLAKGLGAPLVLSRFSRLLIDPNRGEDDPTLVMRLSDGAIIGGNRYLDAAELQRRIERFYRPYDDAIHRVVATLRTAEVEPVLMGMHSFTPLWKGVARPWHCGVLWNGDDRIAGPLLEALRAEGDLVVGDNQPYPGQYEGDTLWRHATRRGLPFASLEVRQDLIADEAGQQAWGERLARILSLVLEARR